MKGTAKGKSRIFGLLHGLKEYAAAAETQKKGGGGALQRQRCGTGGQCGDTAGNFQQTGGEGAGKGFTAEWEDEQRGNDGQQPGFLQQTGILFSVCNVVFFVYDMGLSRLIGIYSGRLARRLGRMGK